MSLCRGLMNIGGYSADDCDPGDIDGSRDYHSDDMIVVMSHVTNSEHQTAEQVNRTKSSVLLSLTVNCV